APRLNAGRYVYTRSDSSSFVDDAAVVMVSEAEGLTLVLPQERADELGLPYEYVAAWINLEGHTSQDARGLTAAVSRCLAEAGMSANVVAWFTHDHVFVPYGRAQEAMDVLTSIAAS